MNATGLMWENAPSFNALIVFAEHRFFGKSLPCKQGFEQCGQVRSKKVCFVSSFSDRFFSFWALNRPWQIMQC